MDSTDNEKRLMKVFFPYAYGKMNEVADGANLVHYTDAEAAMKIIQNKEIWMRRSDCMNDYTEVSHGLGCLQKAYQSEVGEKFKAELDNIFGGISKEIEDFFNEWIPNMLVGTYITCLSEHPPGEETSGRLSMWRAYGQGTTGVALVLNTRVFRSASDALKVYSSPVAYFGDSDFEKEFQEITNAVVKNSDFLRDQGREVIKEYVFTMFRSAAVCTKNPAFLEEKEWRVFCTPTFDQPRRLIEETKVINSAPQRILKIPLQNVPEEELYGLQISELIDKVIIGPTQYPIAIAEAFVDILRQADVPEPESRVTLSNIPLRQ